jgi:hypothetical protein
MLKVGNYFLGANFGLDAASMTWDLSIGSYDNNKVRGYWIYIPGARQAWQRRGNGALDKWNRDGQAKGPPQNDEMFLFESTGHCNEVRIKSIYGPYLRLDGGVFTAPDGTKQEAAAVFSVQFPG